MSDLLGPGFLPTGDTGVTPSGLHSVDLELLRSCARGEGLIPLPSELWKELADAVAKVQTERATPLSELMTPERCAFVRQLRVDQGYSWRSVAAECHRAWSIDLAWWWPTSNQLIGMDLCEVAAQHSGEKFMEDPWN